MAIIEMLNIGFNNVVSLNRVISIISPESAPVKRILQEAKKKNLLINATYGRKARAVIIMDSGHVILSPVQPKTVSQRIKEEEK